MKACVDEQDLRPAEEKLVKMELNEAVTMVDHFEIERILNSAQVYGLALGAKLERPRLWPRNAKLDAI